MNRFYLTNIIDFQTVINSRRLTTLGKDFNSTDLCNFWIFCYAHSTEQVHVFVKKLKGHRLNMFKKKNVVVHEFTSVQNK